ncbi:ATP-dependent DNA helicase HMI1 mitochondrial precursor [Scheffersomyces xylosifermentans]|uniref:ATP-dependent DNA helicase HMI1 mitochondrial precursor n=1 Tax=Scheffersomyces xylosifermentans TaxID=1304137 RepID=UPI00315D391C
MTELPESPSSSPELPSPSSSPSPSPSPSSSLSSLPSYSLLSPSQREVAEFPPSPQSILAVRAGPGSGKTFTMVNRIATLMSKYALEPEEILVLSMTNRAVNSLRGSLDFIINNNEISSKLELRTFHSFCASLVDQYGHLYFQSSVKRRLMDDLSWRSFSNIFSAKTISIAGKKVEGSLTASSLERILQGIKSGEFSLKQASDKFKVNKDYLNELLLYLEQNGMMRYQDFIADAISIMDSSSLDKQDETSWIPQLAKYKVIIIDEIQDMHYSLLKVIKKVANYPTYGQSGKHLTFAGDPNQCIYEFLGSSPELLQKLSKDFPNYETNHYNLQETFRLTPQILEAATEIAVKRQGLQSIPLQSVKPDWLKPTAYTKDSPVEEYDYIISEITRLILESGGLLKPADFIILARTNKETQAIEEHMRDLYGLKANKFSSSATWASSRVHVLLDIVNVINQGPGSDFGLLCSILKIDKKPGAKLRVSKLFTLYDQWRSTGNSGPCQGSNLEEFITSEIQKLKVKSTDKKATNSQSKLASIYKSPDHKDTLHSITVFLNSIRDERVNLKSNDTPKSIISSLYEIMSKSDLLEYLNTPDIKRGHSPKVGSVTPTDEQRQRLDRNIAAFYLSLKNSYSQFIDYDIQDNSFLEYFLKTYNDDIAVSNPELINISTIHMAKGLEFPVVFLPGSPSSFGSSSYWASLLSDEKSIPEPSKGRLFYVACTRAKNLLYIGIPGHFDDLPSSVSDLLTNKVPTMSSRINERGSLLENLSFDLNRPIPSRAKIKEGSSLLKSLNIDQSNRTATGSSITIARKYHTVSTCSTHKVIAASIHRIKRVVR